MRGCGRWRGLLRVACVTAAFTFATIGPVRPDESNVRLRGRPGAAVWRALEGALLRLEEPDCRQVFSEFRDSAGRALQTTLDELGQSPDSYLRGLVFFYDGASQPRCASGEILGGTRPGSRVIYVCPLQFVETDRRDARATEVFIIHETLHSLGLGENPPASAEINWRVMKRCPGRVPISQRRPSAR